MIKLYRIFKTQLLIVALLFGANMSFAQVVTVPSGCTVKVAGTGGNIALNQVGNGGIVAMPDNYPGGSFSCTVPAGYSQGAWTLKGDLSVVTASSSGSPVQPAGTLSAYSIESYNKFRRETEGAFGSAASRLAKSKGKVSISYINGPCNGVGISFEVYKTYTVPPAIVGPNCLTAGVSCTFSVDRVASDNTSDNIGFDQYYWTGLPPYINGTYYASADNSSITFTPSSIPTTGITIKCCLGRANPWDGGTTSVQALAGTACITKVVGVLPSAPSLASTQLSQPLTAGLNVCVDTGIVPLLLTYPTPVSGTSYTWSTSNNWTWSISTSGTTQTMALILDNNSGELKLRVQNNCSSVDYVYKITRKLTSAVAISGPSCITTNVASSFNLGASAAVNATEWSVTVPPSVTPVSGFTFNLDTLTTTASITATAAVPPGQYTLNCKSTGYSYNGNSCQGTITKIINVAPSAPSLVMPLTNCVIKGTTQVTSIQAVAVAGATYSWDLTQAPGWSILSGGTTASPIFIPTGTTAGPVTIKVKRLGTNGCDSNQVSLSVSYYAIVGNFQPSPFSDQYALSCGTADSWSINNGPSFTAANLPPNVTILNSNTTLSIGGNSGVPITAVCTNVLINGVSTPICATTFGNHTAARQSSIPKIGGEKLDGMNVYPNPNNGEFFINVTDYKNAVAAIITDNSGKELGTFELTKGENKIAIGNLAKGIYFVTLLKDGKSEVRQLIIE